MKASSSLWTLTLVFQTKSRWPLVFTAPLFFPPFTVVYRCLPYTCFLRQHLAFLAPRTAPLDPGFYKPLRTGYAACTLVACKGTS